MVYTQVFQSDVPNSGIDVLSQLLVTHYGGVLASVQFLLFKYIVAVCFKLQSGICGYAFTAFLFGGNSR